jgi:NitT/TauT family transport system ATP-binding protein
MSDKIVVDGVTKIFRDEGRETRALECVSLRVADGEFVSVLGPSGCGKTTLLRILDGLTRADAGRVEVGGQPVSRPLRNVGFVFQVDSLWPWRDVLRNVTFGLEIQGRARPEADATARELLRLVGLEGFEHHLPHQLSVGMRQRVNLARALAIDPEVILMDEPFAALDAQTREMMQLELMRIWSVRRKTVVFVTHQIDEAVFLSDRVVVMSTRPGRVREEVLVGFPRPRGLTLKRTPEFNRIVGDIWQQIEDEVAAGFRGARYGGTQAPAQSTW